MTVSLGSNISAIAQDNLAQAQKIVTQTVQSLSSGKRINGAADDPASLAISQALTGQVNAINQSLLNLNNGTNLLQVADSNLSTMQNMLLQMQQLATQGQDPALSTTELGGIAQQLTNLYAGMTQVASGAKYNGQSLFVNNSQFDTSASILKLNQTNLGVLDTTVVTSVMAKEANTGTYTFSNNGAALTLSKLDNAGDVVAHQTLGVQDFRGDTGNQYQTLNYDQLGISMTLQTTPCGIKGVSDSAAMVASNLSNLYHPIVIDNGPAITISSDPTTANYLNYQPQNVVSLTGGDSLPANPNLTLANSSNSNLVTATTNNSTAGGNYNIAVQSLAAQTSFNLTGFTTVNDAVGITNSFTFSVGGNTYGVNGSKTDSLGNTTIDASRVLSTGTTATQFVNWVNNLNDNVSACLDQVSAGNYQIEIKGSLTGANNAVSFSNLHMITSKDIQTNVVDTGTVSLAADGVITNSEWNLPVKENPAIVNGSEAVTYSTANYSGLGTSLSNGVLNTNVPFNASWGAPVNDLTRYLSFAVTNIDPASASVATSFHIAGYANSASNAGVTNNFSLTVGGNTYYANGTQTVGGVSTYDPNRALSASATVSDLASWINSVGTTTHLAQVSGYSGASGLVQGTYNNVALTSNSGSGTGATANIVVNSSGQIQSFAINAGGSGYKTTDQLSLAAGWGGAANGAINLTSPLLLGSADAVTASVQTTGGHAELVVQGTQTGTAHAVTFANLNLITSTDASGNNAHYNNVSLASDGLQTNGEWSVALYETVGNQNLLYSVTPAFYGSASQSSKGSILSNGDLNTNIPFAAAWGAPSNNLNRFLTFALTGVNVAQDASLTVNGRSISSSSNKVSDTQTGMTMYLNPLGNSPALPSSAVLSVVNAPAATLNPISATGMRNVTIAMTQTVNALESSTNSNANTNAQTWNSFFSNLSGNLSSAIDFLSSKRSQVGSQMNQIAYVVSNAQLQSTNLQNANSALVDTNYASQTSNLAKELVTEQAAAKMQSSADNFPTVMKTLMQQWGLIKVKK
jgi:flagellin